MAIGASMMLYVGRLTGAPDDENSCDGAGAA
jgi:hypothetical protein